MNGLGVPGKKGPGPTKSQCDTYKIDSDVEKGPVKDSKTDTTCTTDDEVSALKAKEEDPFEGIVYDECVKLDNSLLANFIGYVDYTDRYYSRKFQLLEHPVLNWVFLFFAWIFNKQRVMIQIPLIFMGAY